MEHEARPQLHALVAYFCPPFGVMTEPKVMRLEDAAEFAQFGFTVLVDPEDERDLATWERLQRVAIQPKRKWFDAGRAD